VQILSTRLIRISMVLKPLIKRFPAKFTMRRAPARAAIMLSGISTPRLFRGFLGMG